MNNTYIYVYQTICEVNGKSYVGVHKTKNINDGYIGCGVYNSNPYRKNSPFQKAVIKYGYTSFTKYILSFYDDYNEALEEERFIVNNDWVKKSDNYNCAIGGRGSVVDGMSAESILKMKERMSASRLGRRCSQETKDKISKKHKGKKLSLEHRQKLSDNHARPSLGKKLSEEAKNKLSILHKGKKLSEEHKKKLSDIKKGRKSNNCKPIIQYDLNMVYIKEFESSYSAAKELDILSTSIHNNMSGLSRSCAGFIFKKKEV